MKNNECENNQVAIMGKAESGLQYSHEIHGEGFYTMDVAVSRLSDAVDHIPVMVSEQLIDTLKDYEGQYISVTGELRSRNLHTENRSHLILSVFAREVALPAQEDARRNQIFLDGYLCKEPVYRETPLRPKIADLLLAVNRPYGKADYIPCICWGWNAQMAAGFKIGCRLQNWGRIQSREYMKKLDGLEIEKKTAYEVSVSGMEHVNDKICAGVLGNRHGSF